MKVIILAAVLPLFLFSCKRLDGDTLVEGQVVDKHTGAAIPHAWVEVYESRGSASWGGYAFVEKHQANANGDFGFQFNSSGDDFLLRAYTELGHSTSWNDAINVRQGKNNKNLKLKADAPAWVKIILEDEPPLGNSSYIYLWGYGGSGDNFSLYNSASLIRQIYANQSTTIYWDINVSGVLIRGTKELNISALDTIPLEIKF